MTAVAPANQLFTLTNLGGMNWFNGTTALAVNDTFSLADDSWHDKLSADFWAGLSTASLHVSDGANDSAIASFVVRVRHEADYAGADQQIAIISISQQALIIYHSLTRRSGYHQNRPRL